MKTISIIIISVIVFLPVTGQGPTKNKIDISPSRENDSLKVEVLRMKTELEKLGLELVKYKQETILAAKLQYLLQGYNSSFELAKSLEDIYTDNFILNWKYQKLEPADFKKIASANLIAEGLIYSEPVGSKYYILGNSVLDFNQNRLVLDTLTNQILAMPYDSLNSIIALEKLAKLPRIKEGSKINEYKEKLIKLITDYSSVNCLALNNYTFLYNKSKLFPLEKSKSVKYYEGISQEYTYLIKALDALFQNPENYQKPGFTIPNSCPPPAKEEPIKETDFPQDN